MLERLDFSGCEVSTHSRLKAAGNIQRQFTQRYLVSTHSRLKAAGDQIDCLSRAFNVSTHSRLKAAGFFQCFNYILILFQHTAA